MVSGFLLLLFGIAYYSYAQRKYVPVAAGAGEVFHRRFATAMDDQIYFDSDSAWSDEIDPDTERKFFGRIRRKMGRCTYSAPLSWGTNSTPKGTTVTVTYQAHCANGLLGERFIWRIIGTKALLVSYNATSNLLLTD